MKSFAILLCLSTHLCCNLLYVCVCVCDQGFVHMCKIPAVCVCVYGMFERLVVLELSGCLSLQVDLIPRL